MIKPSITADYAAGNAKETSQERARAAKDEQKEDDSSLLATLPLVQKIIRKKLRQTGQAERSDIIQSVALRLWNWRTRYREKSEAMTADEWENFAARTAYNELNRHFTRGAPDEEPLDAAMEVASPENVAGDSRAELQSLARFLWQQICQISLRQRRALLLNSHRLVVYLLRGGVTDEDLMTALEFAPQQWFKLKDKLPLSDAEIADLSEENVNRRSPESAVKSVKKARHEARARLKQRTKQ